MNDTERMENLLRKAPQLKVPAGLGDVPLICARELDIEGATPRCIRVLVHLATERTRDELHHVYQQGARNLRDDLPE